jgi:hypothetical protein
MRPQTIGYKETARAGTTAAENLVTATDQTRLRPAAVETRVPGRSALPEGQGRNRGRRNRVVPGPPPSEPDRRFSRIRLSSRWFYLQED